MIEESQNENETPDNQISLLELQEKEKNNGSILEPFIGGIDEVFHEYHADNPYILKGYRVHFVTVPRILKSLFMIHNESFNTWSHLMGFFAAIALFIVTYLTISEYRLLYEKEIINSSDSVKSIYDSAIILTNHDNVEANRTRSFEVPLSEKLNQQQ